MSIQTQKNRFFAAACAVAVALVMVVMMLPLNILAAENQEVTEASKGVVQVNIIYRDDNNVDNIIGYGSGFLINSDTVLTCDHVIDLGIEDMEWLTEQTGKSEKEVRDRLSYSITVSRDVMVKVSKVVNQSREMDWAILQLEQSIQGKDTLAIRPSSEVRQTEIVYSIGFPLQSSIGQTVPTFTSDDVTITEGTVNKVATGHNFVAEIWGLNVNYDYIQTNVLLNGGNSGGPMVDEHGNVVGICQSSDAAGYFYAVAIDQVTTVLDSLGIDYTKAGEPAEVPTEEATEPEVPEIDKASLESAIAAAEAIDGKGYTKESFSALQSALDNAKAVNAKADAAQDEIDQAASALKSAQQSLAEQKGLDMKWIIIIAAAVVVIAAVIIIIVVISSKKKKAAKAPANKPAGPATSPIPPQRPPVAPQGMPQQPQGFTPVAPVPPAAGDGGETTVLSSDAGETTILAQNVNGGTLISAKGDKVTVNAAEFTIGRERSRVNYCISGNTNVGRVHAKIVVRNGQAFLVDLKATNGTFVNGVKCTPMQEVQLKSGDKIAFANEEYTYQA